jgi:sulfur carrier protein ThiS
MGQSKYPFELVWLGNGTGQAGEKGRPLSRRADFDMVRFPFRNDRRTLGPPFRAEVGMARVVLASALSRWLPQAAAQGGEVALEVPGATLGDVLEGVFARHPTLRGYVLDERRAVRHHVAVFVDGEAVRDKRDLSQALGADAEVYVMQALSGG